MLIFLRYYDNKGIEHYCLGEYISDDTGITNVEEEDENIEGNLSGVMCHRSTYW